MGIGSRTLRALFGVCLFVGFIWFLFADIIGNHVTTTKTAKMVSTTRNFKHWKFVAEERHPFHQDFNLNYVSKRRVPNGPDPIHNRRAEKSRRPPGRA
ncbi:hypothetical protein SLEP1_g10226 [Rubroshorea leprosula]|uniref:CLAVATA3/ESR (CLE)-related protein 25 n=2 Tax=Rubroshorea leprosula TaxID=152421 RepID=A0AAV5I7E1_9ROSI|nr:hypothetical protein SLEP1_g10226 [Rubroshorea leprosula]